MSDHDHEPDRGDPSSPDVGGPETDPGANTEMFRAFVRGGAEDGPVQRGSSRTPFRAWSLLVGLAVFVLIAWLLLRG